MVLLSTLLLFSVSACVRHPTRTQTVRASIEQSIARSVEATKAEDIDAYMAEIPGDFVLHDESGAVVSQAQQRADVLRDWSVIARTIAISTAIDSIEVQGDMATVYTSGRWERLMLRPDGKTTDVVLTTQKHRETWRETSSGWRSYDIKELGGEIFINGQPYKPSPHE
jgi:ketosteroid isomerase-like protein